ncbi:MAG: glycosyltransferase family 2 protein [Chloroflexi bacterium]|nr:glycosyltransferase family 2 protein [Chloroflexota bacterium]
MSVVIPVYRGETTIPSLVEQLAKALPELADAFEVILVHDGSPDGSWKNIERLAARYPWMVGIRLMRNYGQHNATLCGVRAAKYELIVTMDQDLQHPPQEILKMVEKLEQGYDVVYGSPARLPQGFWRNLMTAAMKRLLANVMGIPSIRRISAFRIFRSHLRDAFVQFQNPSLILDVLLSWGTDRFAWVNVNIPPAERTNYNLAALVKASVLILTGFSTAPLRAASWMGFLMTLFGLGILVYVTYVYFMLGSLPGFPFLASIIAIFSGAQLFTLGILGEYLAHIFERSMDRPAYVVQEIIGDSKR